MGGPGWPVAQGGDETAGVGGEEGLGFLIGVDFDVLVGDALAFEGDPDTLDERARRCVSGGGLGGGREIYQNALP